MTCKYSKELRVCPTAAYIVIVYDQVHFEWLAGSFGTEEMPIDNVPDPNTCN